MEIEHAGALMRFFTPNKTTRWRVESLLTKEPDTIEWIASFERGDILFDVGANVGMYSILSAATRGVQVLAFEPESQNYAILNTNILINSLDAAVAAYCLAVSDGLSLDYLHMAYFDPGGSLHNFGAARNFQALFGFLKTDRSFHGVEEISDRGIERNSLLSNIYVNKVVTRKLESAAAPKRWWPWAREAR